MVAVSSFIVEIGSISIILHNLGLYLFKEEVK